MPTKKTKTKRVAVKNLSVAQQELAADEASKVKGGVRATANIKVKEAHPAAFNPKELSVDQSVPWKP